MSQTAMLAWICVKKAADGVWRDVTVGINQMLWIGLRNSINIKILGTYKYLNGVPGLNEWKDNS